MTDEDSELITLYYGDGTDEGQAQGLAEKAEELFDGCDVEMHYGGQPVYPYILSVE